MDTMSDYLPLFKPGFHDIKLEDLDNLFVIPFNDVSRRRELTDNLKIFLYKLREINAKFEVWIDGSYLTKKITPGDVDIAILYDPEEINSIPKHDQDFLMTPNKENKIRYGLDAYFVPDERNSKCYWRGLFGFSREEKPKGIPRIQIGCGHE